MTLKAIVESVDGLDEALRAAYAPGTGEYEGKFVLQVEPVGTFELSDTGGLKSALSKERAAAADAQKALKAFEGIDVAAARDALSKVKEMDGWDADKKLAEHKAKFEADTEAKYAAQMAQLQQKHETEVAERDQLNNRLLDNVKQMSVVNAARAALAEHGGSELLMPHIERQVRTGFDTETGKPSVEVLDADGNVRLSPASGSTAPMNISELVATMKNDDTYKAVFAGSGASGGGTVGGGVKTGPDGRKTVSRSDQAAIDANIEGIASGDVVVVD